MVPGLQDSRREIYINGLHVEDREGGSSDFPAFHQRIGRDRTLVCDPHRHIRSLFLPSAHTGLPTVAPTVDMAFMFQNEIVWRWQSGTFRHLGLSAKRKVVWQKSPVTGNGRLRPIGFVLVVEIGSRRLAVRVFEHPPTEEDAVEFWNETIAKPVSGKAPNKLIFSRQASASFPKLLGAVAGAGVHPIHARSDFKREVHAARYFEQHLRELRSAHSAFTQFDNWPKVLSRVVEGYSEAVSQAGYPDLVRGLPSSWDAVRDAFGVDPERVRADKFRSKSRRVENSHFEAGELTGLAFSWDKYDRPKQSIMHDWVFDYGGRKWRAPLHSHVGDGEPDLWRGRDPELNLADFIVPEESLPAELRSFVEAKARPNRGISLDTPAYHLASNGWNMQDQANWLFALSRLAWIARGVTPPTERHFACDRFNTGRSTDGLSEPLVKAGFYTPQVGGRPRWNLQANDSATFMIPLRWLDPEYAAWTDQERPIGWERHFGIRVSWANPGAEPIAEFVETPSCYGQASAEQSMIIELSRFEGPLLTKEYLTHLRFDLAEMVQTKNARRRSRGIGRR